MTEKEKCKINKQKKLQKKEKISIWKKSYMKLCGS